MSDPLIPPEIQEVFDSIIRESDYAERAKKAWATKRAKAKARGETTSPATRKAKARRVARTLKAAHRTGATTKVEPWRIGALSFLADRTAITYDKLGRIWHVKRVQDEFGELLIAIGPTRSVASAVDPTTLVTQRAVMSARTRKELKTKIRRLGPDLQYHFRPKPELDRYW